jgi:hypothetical protein
VAECYASMICQIKFGCKKYLHKTGLQSFDDESKVARFFLVRHTKTGKNTPNNYKIQNGHKICQMAIK